MDLFEQQQEEFIFRHIGPDEQQTQQMLKTIGVGSLDELMDKTVPANIRLQAEPELPSPVNEYHYLHELRKIASQNKVFKNYIGLGYYGTITPSVIQRNVFENPGWYTQYTPYQAEISQGRLECLLNFQTLVSDLTGLPIANASLLDEATAAAEAMHLLFALKNKGAENPASNCFFVDQHIFPQTKEVLLGRAEPSGIELVFGDADEWTPEETFFGALLQYPDSEGAVKDHRQFIQSAHAHQIPVAMATDLLALTLLTPPGELDADIALGSAQRFGVPLGFGGPHAAFFAVKEEYKRLVPGRIIGVSEDRLGNRALRMALQTREQHIRREKATSNICTAQALLANMAALYAVYHGPEGLKNIAKRISLLSHRLAKAFEENGFEQCSTSFFDTLKIKTGQEKEIRKRAGQNGINFRYFDDGHIGISIDETTTQEDLDLILNVFTQKEKKAAGLYPEMNILDHIPFPLVRTSDFLTHPVFNIHHSETKMMRYLKQLENKDLALDTSMIPLGSCTMKLNAASELIPVSWPEFAHLHPYAPEDQAKGYLQIIHELEKMLCSLTGFKACSLQPNSGAQGEFTGLMTIRAYHHDHGQAQRNVVIIPVSAHGTNPASAVMAGMQVVVVKCDERGNIDVEDLREKAEKNKDTLVALMVTYPSTYGVFEESIKEICQIIHDNGGLVYLDGANMNAQAMFTSPAAIGADVCHLNLHKTFAIPHGGGGPGMGPVCANEKLAPYLPGDPIAKSQSQKVVKSIHAISAARYSSASILLISYGYLRMLGAKGIKKVTEYAVLNANYMKTRLEKHYPVLYSGKNNFSAHEFIVDLRPFKKLGIEAEDVAKRLMDYNFHAPTLAFPVPGTLMIEPTESEDQAELDRFCDAMIAIREEITAIENGKSDPKDNPLKNAPHIQQEVTANEWHHSYSRQQAAFPLDFVKENKFWPSVARVNNTLGDRNLICTCEPVEAYAETG